MATLTTYNSEKRAIERDPVTLVFDVSMDVGATTSEEVTLMAMPANVKYLGGQIQCLVADTGSGAVVCTLKHGATTFFTGEADNGGTANKIDIGVTALAGTGDFAPAADTSAAGNLIASLTQASGTSTVAAKWRIILTVLRTDY